MKKIAMIIVALVLSVGSTNAQTTKAYFDKNSKQKLNERIVTYVFQVDNITGDEQRLAYENKFKAAEAVSAVKSSMVVGNKRAVYSISVPQKQNKQTLQKMLLASGINMMNIEGEDVKTVDLLKFVRAHKAQK